MRILHVISDNKFANPVVDIFERTSHSNEYVCVLNDGECMKYISNDKVVPVQKSDSWKLWCNDEYDAYMFHPLYGRTYEWVLAIPDNKIVIASSWGADLYYSQEKCQPLLLVKLYRQETKKILDRLSRPQKSLYKRVKAVLGRGVSI